MDNEAIKAKAMELAMNVTSQIREARETLVKEMLEKGQRPEDYQVCDNMLDIVEGTTLNYKCWSIKKPSSQKTKPNRSKRKNV